MIDNITYYRPIQYLGSKSRVVSTIVSECEKLYKHGEFIVDLFSGSSVVSQSLYNKGMHIIANDILSFSSDIAACMLNQARNCESSDFVKFFIDNITLNSINSTYIKYFDDFIAEEYFYLSDKDLLGLKKLYEKLPQVGNTVRPNEQVLYIRNHWGFSAINNPPLFANYYSGTYFGIRQALEIDLLRRQIEYEWDNKKDIWEKNILLSALYNTCSIIVNSAGKHFAQPLGINDTNELKITNIRFFENRSYDVLEVFKTCVINILASFKINNHDEKSYALNMDVCTPEFGNIISDKKVSVIYADPPYTAQQYSRFYHIPEVLHSYVYPKLQMFRGSYTKGIYPEHKYKSPFCSKTQAKGAFASIFKLARTHNSSLIISYSESQKALTGNERMISMSDLLHLAESFLPNHSIKRIDFDFTYKQLNSKDKIVKSKEDKELLLIFEK